MSFSNPLWNFFLIKALKLLQLFFVTNFIFFSIQTRNENCDKINLKRTINGTDLKKEFKLKGYEFGKNFEAIRKITIDGEFAQIRAKGSIFVYLSGLLCVPFTNNLKRSITVLAGIEILRINPKSFRELEEDFELTVTYDSVTDTLISDYVFVKGLTNFQLKKINKLMKPILTIQKLIYFKEIIKPSSNESENIFMDLLYENYHSSKISDLKKKKICFKFRRTIFLFILHQFVAGDNSNEKILIENIISKVDEGMQKNKIFNKTMKNALDIFLENHFDKKCEILFFDKNELLEKITVKYFENLKNTLYYHNEKDENSELSPNLIFISKQQNISEFHQNFSNLIKSIKLNKIVWLLLLIRTNLTPAEIAISNLTGSKMNNPKLIIDRISSYGFRCLSENKILNRLTVMLFRKSETSSFEHQKFICVPSSNFKSWMSDLKKKLSEKNNFYLMGTTYGSSPMKYIIMVLLVLLIV